MCIVQISVCTLIRLRKITEKWHWLAGKQEIRSDTYTHTGNEPASHSVRSSGEICRYSASQTRTDQHWGIQSAIPYQQDFQIGRDSSVRGGMLLFRIVISSVPPGTLFKSTLLTYNAISHLLYYLMVFSSPSGETGSVTTESSCW